VLRSVTLAMTLSVLAEACALVEPPPPAGTLMLNSEVRNMRAEPVQLEVGTPAGPLPSAVQPASLPAHTTTNVTLYIPLTDDWSIFADDVPVIVNTEVSSEILRRGCRFGIELAADGAFSYGCDLFP